MVESGSRAEVIAKLMSEVGRCSATPQKAVCLCAGKWQERVAVIVVAASACVEGGALMCGLFPARASEDRATCASPLGAIWVAPTQVHDATAAQSSGECLRVSIALCPQVAEIYRCDADVMQRRSMQYAVGGRGGIVDNTVALASPLAF